MNNEKRWFDESKVYRVYDEESQTWILCVRQNDEYIMPLSRQIYTDHYKRVLSYPQRGEL